MKTMAIDFGDARTGIAISDLTGSIVGVTTVIQQPDPEKTAQEIDALIKQHQVTQLVMGFPKNMDGTQGPRADLYRAFAAVWNGDGTQAGFGGESGGLPSTPTGSSRSTTIMGKREKIPSTQWQRL